jgi:putative membrane protein
MRHLGRFTALAGLILAIVLFWTQDAHAVVSLLAQAGLGLVLAGLFHLLPMILNARAWQVILPGRRRPCLMRMIQLNWIRESANALLPVARLGGEIAAYRLLRRARVRRSPAIASIIVDMVLSVISQFAFAVLGFGLLLKATGATPLVVHLAYGLAAATPLGILLIVVQRVGLLERATRLLDRFAGGRLSHVIGHSARIDRAIRTMYRRRGAIVACLAWRSAGWVAASGEIWLALRFLGYPATLMQSVAIEALIQAVSGAAFIVPGALGVQEGGFLLIAAAFGIGAPMALALAAARRLRDLVVFFPGLLAWQWAERSRPAAAR